LQSNQEIPMRDSLAGWKVLITGASGGIGLEIARCLAARGASLLLVSRHSPHLQEAANELTRVYGVDVRVYTVDLSTSHGPGDLWRQLETEQVEVDILVNNAGFGSWGNFADLGIQSELSQIQLNVVALTELTRLALPGMLARKRGKILQVASIAAFLPGPYMSVYYATKAFVLSFSQALAQELDPRFVTVTTLCPGPTATGFFLRAGLQGQRPLKHLMGMMHASSVAELGVDGLLRGKRVVIPGFLNQLTTLIAQHAPRWLTLPVMAKLQKAPSA
jgi:short-subunit dehydrogenase